MTYWCFCTRQMCSARNFQEHRKDIGTMILGTKTPRFFCDTHLFDILKTSRLTNRKLFYLLETPRGHLHSFFGTVIQHDKSFWGASKLFGVFLVILEVPGAAHLSGAKTSVNHRGHQKTWRHDTLTNFIYSIYSDTGDERFPKSFVTRYQIVLIPEILKAPRHRLILGDKKFSDSVLQYHPLWFTEVFVPDEWEAPQTIRNTKMTLSLIFFGNMILGKY